LVLPPYTDIGTHDISKDSQFLDKEKGLFYHSTSNFDRFRYKGEKSHYVMPEGHIYYFTYEVMKRYLVSAGFKILSPYKCYQFQRKPIKLLTKYGLLNLKNDFPERTKDKVVYSIFKIVDILYGNR